MPRQDAGKWVARAGATGGGRTYRARIPYRWYTSLALIVLLGIFLVVYSRYENLHPPTPASSVAPTTSDHWVAAVVFDLCGDDQQTLASNPNTTTDDLGIYTTGGGVVQIQPKSAADSGTNATLGRFSSRYPGLDLTASSVGLPKKHVFRDGAKCPSGTPDSGKVGQLEAKVWPTATSSTSTLQTGDVRTVRFTQTLQMVTVAFVPSGQSVARPDGKIVTALLDAEDTVEQEEQASTTTTTAATSSTTTTTSSTTTTTTAGKTTTTTK
jgi:hypothetical protein